MNKKKMKTINNNNLKLQVINSAGNHVFEITSSRKEEIKPMKKKKELMLNYGKKTNKKSVSN